MRARSALRAFFCFPAHGDSNTRAVPQRYAAERQRSPSSDGELVAEDEHPDLSTGSIDGDRAASSRRQFWVHPR